MAKLFAGSNKTNPKSYKTGFHDEFHETRFIVVSNYLSGNILNFGPLYGPFPSVTSVRWCLQALYHLLEKFGLQGQ